jgi:hypothetical protein
MQKQQGLRRYFPPSCSVPNQKQKLTIVLPQNLRVVIYTTAARFILIHQ